MEPLELRTHTRLWQVEKKLYKLYDFTLPMPVSMRMLGIFAFCAAIWFPICHFLHVHFGPPFGHIIWLAPPMVVTWFANKPVAEGKRLGDLLISQCSYFLAQHKQYAGLSPYAEPERIRAHAGLTPADPGRPARAGRRRSGPVAEPADAAANHRTAAAETSTVPV